jgi:thioredoxin-like negative regulator of GroEL
MDFTFNTQIVDVSVALNALKFYKAGQYKEATSCLLDLLDVEPKNWDARLMLGACYFKTEQWGAAQRAFRFIFEQCPAADIKSKLPRRNCKHRTRRCLSNSAATQRGSKSKVVLAG